MSSDVVFSAIQTWMAANWTATPVKYENDASPPPLDLSTFLYVEIVGHDYDQISIGTGVSANNLWRETGFVQATVYVATGAGSLQARQYATQLANAWKGLELSPVIRFRDMSIGVGMTGSDNGNWWGLTVRAQWVRN